MESPFSPHRPSRVPTEPGFLWVDHRDGGVRVRPGHPPSRRALWCSSSETGLGTPLWPARTSSSSDVAAAHALRATGLRPPGSPGRSRRVGKRPHCAPEAVIAGRGPERGDGSPSDGVGQVAATPGETVGQECAPLLVPVCCVEGADLLLGRARVQFPEKGDLPDRRSVPGGPGDRGVAKERCVRGPLRWGQLLGVLLGRRRSSRRRVGLSLFGARISVTLA
jgi:hypothetical protein